MKKQAIPKEKMTVRFAGDSGDGMQLSGKLFADAVAASGRSVRTFPDFPSEIRAPEGTLYGVSAFQVNFGCNEVHTAGDKVDILVAMNASSLKTNLYRVKKGGLILTDLSGFGRKNLRLAEYETSPLETDELHGFEVHTLDVVKYLQDILKEENLSPKDIKRTRNIFVLGIICQLNGIGISVVEKWLNKKFASKPDIRDANLRVLGAGFAYAESADGPDSFFEMQTSTLEAGYYRNISGNEAVALGMVAASRKAGLPLFLGSYPITPASEILQFISGYKKYAVKHLQAEDEIAGICSAIGAAYGGYLALTTTSGPGLSLKVEASGLALITELPLVIVNVQRGGPSTGLPTKPEQSDLLMALYGRHGEAPMPVLAASSPSDCFTMSIEASRIALKYMTPVILLTDGYLASSTEPWKVPTLQELPTLENRLADTSKPCQPYKRDPETLSRPWAVPGMAGLEHRIGGLEKSDVTGNVSYDPDNHQKMVALRQQKVDGIVNDIPPAALEGNPEGEALILGWGSTKGAITQAVEMLQEKGISVANVHLNYLNPLPANLGPLLASFDRVIIPEMNSGQLARVIRDKFLKPVTTIAKVKGLPFRADELAGQIEAALANKEELAV